MTNFLAVAVGTVFLFAAGMPLAQDAKAPATNPGAVATKSMAAMPMQGHLGQMDERMTKMRALHEKLNNAATPEARQQVMDEQRQEMHANMEMMNQMTQEGGMKGNAGSGMMAHKGKPASASEHMQMMQKRMDMMQMMMQAMLDQQGTMGGPGNPGALPKQ